MNEFSPRKELLDYLVKLVDRWKELENAGTCLRQALRKTDSTDLIFLMSIAESKHLKEAELAWKDAAENLSCYLSQLQVSVSISEFLL